MFGGFEAEEVLSTSSRGLQNKETLFSDVMPSYVFVT
jgi:hypothetical protein